MAKSFEYCLREEKNELVKNWSLEDFKDEIYYVLDSADMKKSMALQDAFIQDPSAFRDLILVDMQNRHFNKMVERATKAQMESIEDAEQDAKAAQEEHAREMRGVA